MILITFSNARRSQVASISKPFTLAPPSPVIITRKKEYRKEKTCGEYFLSTRTRAGALYGEKELSHWSWQ